jgi:1-acyl-sn-glycerol-3-phosphate acyltransferase
VDSIQFLTHINLDDLVNAFGWQKQPALSHLVRRSFARPAREFARQMVEFDSLIGARGLAEAACFSERYYVRNVRLFGAERLPDGPALMLSNHPGMTDTLALFAALARPDMKILALDRPFLLSLPNLSRQLLFVKDEPHERVGLVRRVVRHLQAGGSILNFPAGHTEPDPENYPGAVDSLESWADSTSVFARLAPETAIVPVCVRGVTWEWSVKHPLVRLRKALLDRMLVSTAFQLLANVALKVKPVTPTIQIGAPIHLGDLGTPEPAAIHHAVLGSMKSLIENVPQAGGQLIW